MRARFLPVLLLAVAGLQSGCGTLLNLYQAPRATGYRAFGPAGCEPYGGTEISCAVGGWMMITLVGIPVGVTIWAVDVPLSLVGDTLTYPLAVARQRKVPWATWWGEQLSAEEAAEAAKEEATRTQEQADEAAAAAARPRTLPVPGWLREGTAKPAPDTP